MLTLFLCFSLETQAKNPTNETELDEAEITRRLHAMENRVVKPRYDPVVMSYLKTYLVRGREGTEQMLGRRFIYFPLFEDVLFQKDLPEELKALSIVESALHNRAISRVGAMGLWQFMAPTARSLGLQVDANIDERLPQGKKSTDDMTLAHVLVQTKERELHVIQLLKRRLVHEVIVGDDVPMDTRVLLGPIRRFLRLQTQLVDRRCPRRSKGIVR